MQMVRLTVGRYQFLAQAHVEAPATVAAFMAVLPMRQPLIHVRWSGEAIWAPMGEFKLGVGFENHTCHPSVGDILFYPGGFSETEILIAYGSCSFASKMGPLAGNHFLTITHGREQLPALGKEILWKGTQQAVFELA